MKITDDHSAELYTILDRAGLTVGNLMDSKRSMPKIVTTIRSQAIKELNNYINKLEAIRQIEVSDE